jgi:hypothetical protein
MAAHDLTDAKLADELGVSALALETLGMTREALVAEFEAQARRINGRE